MVTVPVLHHAAPAVLLKRIHVAVLSIVVPVLPADRLHRRHHHPAGVQAIVQVVQAIVQVVQAIVPAVQVIVPAVQVIVPAVQAAPVVQAAQAVQAVPHGVLWVALQDVENKK